MPYLKETLDAAFKEWISSLNGETEYEQPQSYAFEAGYKQGLKDSLKPKPILCECSGCGKKYELKDWPNSWRCNNCY
jgi:hypothetical protein